MSARDLPSFIHVANFKDIFWNNNSDLYPNNAPNINLYKKINKVRPVFISPLTGLITLEGEYNHCVYNGKYYRLIKVKLIDIPRQRYEYQLEEDVMLNLIHRGAEIRGILNRTNRAEILEGCLHTTQPILDSPALLTINLFKEVKATWQERVRTKFASPEVLGKFLDLFVSSKDWTNSKIRWEGNLYIQALRQGKKWKNTKQARSQAHTYNPLFLIDLICPTIAFSWKAKVLDRIKTFTDDWSDKELSTVSVISGSLLNGKTCITYKNRSYSLGAATESQLELDHLDLSGLTDIQLVDDNGTPINDETRLTSPYRREPDIRKDLLPPGVGEGGTPDIPVGWYLKLCRHPYLPIKKEGEEVDNPTKFLNIKNSSYPPFDFTKAKTYTGESPQDLLFKEGVGLLGSRHGWLWYVNKLDFAITTGWREYYKDDELLDPFRDYSYFDDGYDYGSHYFFRNLNREQIPPVGFLIYQLKSEPTKWDEYEYREKDEPKVFEYRSGLNRNLISEYQKEDRWWSNLPPELANINGTTELSTMTLDLDHFRWLCFAPSYDHWKSYKWIDPNYYKTEPFFNRGDTYIASMLNYDINRNNDNQVNPLNERRIKQFIVDRAKQIDKLSIYSQIQFPNKVKEGDIFCSDLDYRWKNTPFFIKEIPVDVDISTLEEVSKWTGEAAKGTAAAAGAVGLGTIALDMHATWAGLYHLAPKAQLFKKFIQASYVFKHYGGRSIVNIWRASKAGISAAKAARAAGAAKAAITALRAGGWAVRGVAAAKTLGLALLLEGLVYGITKAVEANTADYANRLNNSIWTMGDFFSGQEVDVSGLNHSFVLYLHKGKIKYGVFNQYEKDLRLTNSEEQILEAVEGTTTRSTKFWHIQNLGEFLYTNPKLDNVQETQLFQAVYQAIRNSPDGKIININDEDLDDPTNKITFDLVGTNWYAQFWKGNLHLICKDINDPKDEIVEKNSVTNREIVFQKSVKPSIYSQINQRSDLVIYSTVLPLNTKYTFDPELEKSRRHFLKSRPLRKAIEAYYKDSQGYEKDADPRDYYHVRYETPFDFIDTFVPVYRKEGLTVKKLEIGEYERLKLERQKMDFDYWVDNEASKNHLHDRKVKTARQVEDLDDQYNVSGSVLPVAGARAVQAGAFGLYTGGVKGAVAGAVLGGASTLLSQFVKKYFGAREYDVLKGRITEDEFSSMRDITLQNYSRKQNYEFKKAEHIIALNSLTNTYIKPTPRDDDIQRVINGINKWDDEHIKIYLPSPEQEKIIKDIYDEHGCLCRSERFLEDPLIIKNNMEPGLYQFSNLEHTSIASKYTADLTINEIIRNIFISGTKFIDFRHIPLQEETFVFVVPKGVDLDFDTSNMEDWDDKLWDRYVVTKPKDELLKILKNKERFGLTPEEYEANKDRLEGVDDEELLKNINEIITHRTTGSTHFVLPPPKIDPHEAEKQILTDQLAQKQKEVDQCLKEKQELQETYQALQDKYDQDLKAHESGSKIMADVKRELEKKISDLEFDISTLNEEKTDLTEQLRQCKIDKTNILNAKNTCDLISANKIKELEAKLKKCEDDLKVKNVELEVAKSGIQAKELDCSKVAKELADKALEIDRIQKLLIDKDAELKAKVDLVSKGNEELLAKVKDLKLKESLIAAQKSQIEDLTREKEQHEAKVRETIIATENSFNERVKGLEKQIQDKETELREKTTLLTQCINEKNELQKRPPIEVPEIDVPVIANVCDLMHNIASGYKYNIDIKTRENGFSAFTDLCMKIAQNTKWMRLSRVDADLRKYPIISKMIDHLYELEQIPTIDKFKDAMGNVGWNSFTKWLYEGGSRNGKVDEVIQITDEIKSKLQIQPYVLAVKEVIDELNWLYFKAQTELAQERQEDETIDYFFKHIFPGVNISRLYKQLYGVKPEVAVAHKKFLSIPCDSTQNPILTLSTDLVNIQHNIPIVGENENKSLSVMPEYLGIHLDGETIFPFFYPSLDPIEKWQTRSASKEFRNQIPYWPNWNIYKWNETSPRNQWTRLSDSGTIYGNTFPMFYYLSCVQHLGRGYSRVGSRWSWVGYKIRAWDGNPLDSVCAGSDKNDINNKITNQFYIRNEIKSQTLYSDLLRTRAELWKNRDKIQISDSAKKMIADKNFPMRIFLIFDAPNFSEYKCEAHLNLANIFSGEELENAYKLIGILDMNKWYLLKTSRADNLECLKFTIRSKTINNIIPTYFDPSSREPIIQNDFADMWSLLNYVYKHVKNPTMPLKAPIDGVSLVDAGKIDEIFSKWYWDSAGY